MKAFAFVHDSIVEVVVVVVVVVVVGKCSLWLHHYVERSPNAAGIFRRPRHAESREPSLPRSGKTPAVG